MDFEIIKECEDKAVINTLRNGMLVEFISGHIAEHFKTFEGSVSYKETTFTKWGAVGIIYNSHDGCPETLLIKYKVKIVWNNEKLANHIVGANENNIQRLSKPDEKEWVQFINGKISELKEFKELSEPEDK